MIDKQVHRNEFKLRLLLTNECNRQCSFCLNDFQEKPDYYRGIKPQFLDSNIAANAMVAYTRMNIKYPRQIYFSGGEPTLHPHLQALIERGKKLKVRMTLNSNGSFITNKSLVHDIKYHVQCKHLGVYEISEEYAKLIKYLDGTIQCVYSKRYPYVTKEFLEFYMGYNIPIKIFCDLLEDTSEYLNFVNEVKNAYPEYPLMFRHTGVQENRGPGCNGCTQQCVTLKGAWVFPDGGVSYCPQRYTVRNVVHYPRTLSEWMDVLIEIEKLHSV